MQPKGNTDSQKSLFQQIETSRFKPIYLFYVLLVILAIILPLVLWELKKLNLVPFVSFTRPQDFVFELFGGFISFILVLITWLEIKRRKIKDLATLLPILLGLLVTFTFIFNIAETTFDVRPKSDYIAFEKGAKAIFSGINPYIEQGNPYVYPPLVGQVMALLYQIITQIPLLQFENEDKGWKIVFYLYQCSQLLLIMLAYYLNYRLARNIGLKSIPASLIVTAFLIFNQSVIRTLNFHQTNLWILNCFLIGILLQQSYPFISGFAIALGVHIKMYPFILILPWVAMRKWRLVAGSGIGLLAIAIVQTNFGRDWTILRYFLDYMKNVSKPTPYRNNSINSVITNFFQIPHKLFGTSFDLVPLIVSIITVAIIIWFLIRFLQRERIYRQLNEAASSDNQNHWNEIYRFYGHSMDAIALGLLISPSVYEHHFIVAIPVALWAIVTRRLDKPAPIAFGIFLIFCVPTFDLFPFSFHRLVGLLIIVYFTAPESLRNYFLRQSKRSANFRDSRNLLLEDIPEGGS
ncbi:MAG: glycosyltransferase family 87 protein [Phormidium sp.]